MTEFCPRSQRNCFEDCEAKQDSVGYPSLYSTIYFELLQRNQGLLCNGIWEGAISAMKIYSFLTDVQCSFFSWCTVRTRRGFLKTSKQSTLRPESVFSYPFFNYLWEFSCKVGQHTVLLDLVKLSNFLI